MKNSSPVLEVCVDSLESALAAEQGGATRVELCSGLAEGGITPSAGLIATVRQKISITLHVMIRPRPGDFYYSSDEFGAMQRDVLMAKQLGADGVVFGILDLDGSVDIARTRQLVDLAAPLQSTFHRAFDMSIDLSRSLEDVIKTGAHRILTSGGGQKAMDGAGTLKSLVDAAGKRIVVMACGGINAANAQAVIAKTGVREIHAGLRTPVDSPMRTRNEKLSLGTLSGVEYRRFVVRKEDVEQVVRAMSATTQTPENK
jgi:copper homeostasis protein